MGSNSIKECKLCNDSGAVNNDYCNCSYGTFLEERNELFTQLSAGELDIGQDDAVMEREYEDQKWIAMEEEYIKYLEELSISKE